MSLCLPRMWIYACMSCTWNTILHSMVCICVHCFPVSIFLLFSSDHWKSKTFRLWMLYRTSFTVSIKFGVVHIIIVFVQMMITGNVIIIIQRMRKFMKWRCGQSDVLCVLVAGNAAIACRLKGLNIWLLLIHQQYYNRYLFV